MSFLSFLRVANDADDDAKTTALTALIVAAVHDEDPATSLRGILDQTAANDGGKYLDALHVLPLLVESQDTAAQGLMDLLGKHSPAKEVVIAAQEALERLRSVLEDGQDDESATATVVEVIKLYTNAIPRINLRKKTALETVRPYILEIQETVALAGHCTSHSRELLLETSRLVERVYRWIESHGGGESSLLENLLLFAITAAAPRLEAGLAQRTFEKLYPRLVMRSGPTPKSESVDEVIRAVLTAYSLFGRSTRETAGLHSSVSVFLLAHSIDEFSDPELLGTLLPTLIACLRSNTMIDETLALLLKAVHARAGELSTDVLIPLLTLLPTLASGHPDPQTRHQTFRILALLLARSPPALRLQVLQELTTDKDLPQMRVAAVGLVKEAVLEALNSPSSSQNLFASSAFLRTFGPILFRPNPPDLFASPVSIKDFEESHESKRLVECLSLYFVLLMRDKDNVTGIRDSDVSRSIDHNLINPLRSQLDEWMKEAGGSEDHLHDMMPVVSLQMSLDRVYGARTTILEDR